MYSCGFYFGVSEHFSCALNSVLSVPCLLKVKAERLRSNIFPYDHCVKLHKLVVEHCCPLLTCYLMSVFKKSLRKPEKEAQKVVIISLTFRKKSRSPLSPLDVTSFTPTAENKY